ncbi:NADPH--cytochrome P450 reductase-like protein [Mycena amicta]|nr:NADPH--cytochrome P450 reductase-like protein [Mycena amicta]
MSNPKHKLTRIPQPRTFPFLGNLLDLQDEVPLQAVERMLDIHGSIVKFAAPGGKETIVVGGYDLFDQMCDETRFYKVVRGALAELGKENAQGLFTARSESDIDWQQAHRILIPAFGPLAIEEMFEEMHDITSQLVLKWARQGPAAKISVTEDMTRLTLDTIALCAMDFRFNSFYSDTPHPFVAAMNNTLASRSNANQLSGIIKNLLPSHREQLRQDGELQQKTSRELVKHRRENPTDKKDLLNAMIYGKDPKTGQTMRDDLIAANMTTFLIAGHETTSGLLSFAFALLLLNPRTYFEARKEVDSVVGSARLSATHLKDLKYLNQVLRETLRLHPTAPGFSRGVRPENTEEVVIITDRQGRHFEVPCGDGWLCLVSKVQRDPAVWGADCNEFVPERMADDKFEALPKNAWRPFGTGLRGCIGRAFAWQEALAVLALILQNFDLRLDDPNYELKVVQTLTLKPKDFFVRASLREGITATTLQHRLEARVDGDAVVQPVAKEKSAGAASDAGFPLSILYGSNTGTCQTLTSRLASEAAKRGFRATIADLDSGVGRLPRDHPVLIITASYEGQPPDNAARFVAWLESLDGGKQFEGVKFAVFGVGHKDWASTYQRIPRLVDDLLVQHGGERLAERGLAEASKRDVSGDFSAWTESQLWPSLTPFAGTASEVGRTAPVVTIEVDVQTEDRAVHLQQNLSWAKVVDARQLAKVGSQKHHIEFELPEGMSYTAGDYLAVLPVNPPSSIRKVMSHFSLPPDGIITIRSSSSATLPVDKPLRITDLLQGYAELAQPATRNDIETLVQYASDGAAKTELQSVLNDKKLFTENILDKRASVLDLLTAHNKFIALPFPVYLEMLPPLQPRYYSISSSPLSNANRCTLTYTVIEGSSWAAAGNAEPFVGVSGNYLRSLKPGDQALVGIRSTNKLFRLPADQEKTPLVMICAGSGIAPFRGFIQERAVLMQEGGRTLARAILFVGCRTRETDRLYAEEMDAWAKMGVVEVRYAFSREAEQSEGCKYVQDRMLRDERDICDLFDEGAKFYICAGPEVAKGVGKAARTIIAHQLRDSASEEQISEYLKSMRNERFVSDVF